MTICWENVRIERRFGSDEALARPVMDELLDGLRNAGWREGELFSIHLALEEAIANAMEHGNGLDPHKVVTVAAEISPLLFQVCIRDEGRGFDPARVPDPTSGDRLHTPHGRGVLIMRQLMHAVKYNERGNEVVMEKRRVPEE